MKPEGAPQLDTVHVYPHRALQELRCCSCAPEQNRELLIREQELPVPRCCSWQRLAAGRPQQEAAVRGQEVERLGQQLTRGETGEEPT